MPEGIAVDVADGYATIDFVDRSTKGPGLVKLLKVAGPESISKDTRSGPRHLYVVAEEHARAAGLLDEPADIEPESTSLQSSPVTPAYPAGEPDETWTRAQLDGYAKATHGLDTAELPDNAAVLDLLK